MRSLIIILTLLIHSSDTYGANKKTSQLVDSTAMLYYQPLYDLKPSDSSFYIKRTAHLLLSEKDSKFKKILKKNPMATRCLKKGLKNCKLLSDPTFHRIQWNKLALSINIECNTRSLKLCKPLSELHDSSMKKYMKIIKGRKQKRRVDRSIDN